MFGLHGAQRILKMKGRLSFINLMNIMNNFLLFLVALGVEGTWGLHHHPLQESEKKTHVHLDFFGFKLWKFNMDIKHHALEKDGLKEKVFPCISSKHVPMLSIYL